MVRSAGQYNLSTSEAAINMSQAQSNYIRNREQWTNAYYEMRASKRAYRAAERGPRPTSEDITRLAQAGRPKRLSSSQLDFVSGAIHWPAVLQTDRYTKHREELEKLLAQRASAGTTTWDVRTGIDKATKSLLEELKGQIRELPPSDYMVAKRFVESLTYETKVAAGALKHALKDEDEQVRQEAAEALKAIGD